MPSTWPFYQVIPIDLGKFIYIVRENRKTSKAYNDLVGYSQFFWYSLNRTVDNSPQEPADINKDNQLIRDIIVT